VMNKMLHVSEVSGLAREIENRSWQQEKRNTVETWWSPERSCTSNDNLMGLIASANEEDNALEDVSVLGSMPRSVTIGEEMEKVVDTDDIDPYTGKLSTSQRARIGELLGRWEEPARGPTQSVRTLCLITSNLCRSTSQSVDRFFTGYNID
jgi:hypothetical protein